MTPTNSIQTTTMMSTPSANDTVPPKEPEAADIVQQFISATSEAKPPEPANTTRSNMPNNNLQLEKTVINTTTKEENP
eukprot:9484148-Ditylum_brightwellii.AAC.1